VPTTGPFATVTVIDAAINEDIIWSAYYLPLCFLVSNVVQDPKASHHLEPLLGDLGAKGVEYTNRGWVPAYLKQLTSNLWVNFQKVQDTLKRNGFRMEWIGFGPEGLTAEQGGLKVTWFSFGG
jgi:hypothetical protein